MSIYNLKMHLHNSDPLIRCVIATFLSKLEGENIFKANWIVKIYKSKSRNQRLRTVRQIICSPQRPEFASQET